MTDLEITKRCAEKMIAAGEYRAFHAPVDDDPWVEFSDGTGGDYCPLHDDAQAMRLVKKFDLEIDAPVENIRVVTAWDGKKCISEAASTDLNRAICECVAQLPD